MTATVDVRPGFGGKKGVGMVRARQVLRRMVLSAAVGVLVVASALVAPVSTADTAPATGTPATVSDDALPTWQVNGVVWSQVTVGNTVYATGSFSKARPPGVAEGGPGEITAQNIFAYDIRTGARVKTFRHGLNAAGLVITASPDRGRIVVGGYFTRADGHARGHVAAYRTSDGALGQTIHPAPTDLSGQSAISRATSTSAVLSPERTGGTGCGWLPSAFMAV